MQHIHCIVEHRPTRKSFALTVVYGSNEVDERKNLWKDLYDISGSITGAWVVLGDFNDVLNIGE